MKRTRPLLPSSLLAETDRHRRVGSFSLPLRHAREPQGACLVGCHVVEYLAGGHCPRVGLGPRRYHHLRQVSFLTNPMPYRYQSCISLFGYARGVHQRSGGICAFCGAGRGQDVDFDSWRQLTVEHLIKRSQGGSGTRIRAAVDARFPELSADARATMSRQIEDLNTVTSCQFCNSMTSHMKAPTPMWSLIASGPSAVAELLTAIDTEVQTVLARKRTTIEARLQVVRQAFEREIRPTLREARESQFGTQQGSSRAPST